MLSSRNILLQLLVFLVSATSLLAAEPSKDPVLRVETGTHTQNIRAVATDRNGSVMATAGYDRSVRVWNMSDGKLLKILRPPLGRGNESLLYSVAMTANGSLVACGGFTSIAGGKAGKPEEGYYVYLFSRASGKMLKRISGIPSVIATLDFSPDGRLLAVGYPGGVRIYQIRFGQDGITATMASEESLDKEKIESVKFSPDGKAVVSASNDGIIRRYTVTPAGLLAEAAHHETGQDSFPRSLSFSPDGMKLAVGYNSVGRIDVLDAADLAVISSPQLGAHGKSTYIAVAWSPDGRHLYAAGNRTVSGAKVILDISADSGVAVQTTPLGGVINALAVMPDGRIIAVSSDPGIAVYSAKGVLLLEKLPAQLTFAPVKDKLKVSQDGLSVLLVMLEHDVQTKRAQRKLLFSLGDRTLTTVSSTQGGDGFDKQLTSHKNFEIVKGKAEFTVNGKSIKVESSSSYQYHVVSADGESALIATNFKVFCVDRSGKIRWSSTTAQTVSDLAISEDGRIAVIANASGSLAWHSMKNGAWLVSLLLIKDNQRWVLWTPFGYYDASPGGEDLIGWHINNGKDKEADFFPASRFRKDKYKPELISSFIEDFNLDKLKPAAKSQAPSPAVSTTTVQADEETVTSKDISATLPPVITITSPQEGTRITSADITIGYEATSAGDSPVTGVRVLVDGRPIQTASRSLKAVDKVIKSDSHSSITITVPEKDSEVSLIAENRHGASVPASIRLVWGGASKNEEFVAKPKLYALAVGVSEYAQKDLSLKYAAKDARDFAQALLKQKDGLYRDVSVKVLTDSKATRDEIMDGLDWLQKETTSRDVAIVFIAGHGVNDPTGIYYYLPHNTDPDKLKRTGVAFTDIKNTLTALPGKAILFVDTCHSGNVMGGRRGLTDINSIVNELSSAENGVVVFASSTGRQYSLEDDKWGNGAFTKALVEGLSGGADMLGKGKITINMLDLYLSEKVKELTGGKQTPTTTKPQTVPDFPVAVRR
ncbi:MAG: caspase family protein [Desulfuromonadales bacterium]